MPGGSLGTGRYWVMCWKCDEVDKVVLHYQTLIARVIDEQTVEGLQRLIEKMEAEKVALHPKPME